MEGGRSKGAGSSSSQRRLGSGKQEAAGLPKGGRAAAAAHTLRLRAVDLWFQPSEVAWAYWRERSGRLSRRDATGVALLCLAACAWAAAACGAGAGSCRAAALASAPLAALACGWMLCWAASPPWYRGNRLAVVLALRCGLAALQAAAASGDGAAAAAVALATGLPAPTPAAALIAAVVLHGCLPHTLLELLALRLPFGWQAAVAAAKGGLVLWGSARLVQRLVVLPGAPGRPPPAALAEQLMEAWTQAPPGGVDAALAGGAPGGAAAAVAPAVLHGGGQPVHGACSSVLLLVAAVQLSGTLLALWLEYLQALADARAWLARRAHAAAATESEALMVGGVCVSAEQLLAARDTLLASTLLAHPGGPAVMMAAHATILGLLVVGGVVVAQLLVWQLLPSVGGAALSAFCGGAPA